MKDILRLALVHGDPGPAKDMDLETINRHTLSFVRRAS